MDKNTDIDNRRLIYEYENQTFIFKHKSNIVISGKFRCGEEIIAFLIIKKGVL